MMMDEALQTENFLIHGYLFFSQLNPFDNTGISVRKET